MYKSDVDSTLDSMESANLYSDRRVSARHQTTIVVENPTGADRFSKRGDINRDGTFFIPDLDLLKGTELVLQVRLPGLGEWIKCGGVVTGVSVRGRSRGIVGRISRFGKRSEDFIDIWKEMVK